MRIAVGVVGILISGVGALFGLGLVIDGALTLAHGTTDTHVADAWPNHDPACPTTVHITWGDGQSGVFECADADVRRGDTLPLYANDFDGVVGSADDAVGMLVFGIVVIGSQLVLLAIVLGLLLSTKKPRPTAPPYPSAYPTPYPSAYPPADPATPPPGADIPPAPHLRER